LTDVVIDVLEIPRFISRDFSLYCPCFLIKIFIEVIVKSTFFENNWMYNLFTIYYSIYVNISVRDVSFLYRVDEGVLNISRILV